MDPCSIPALAITVAGLCLTAATDLASFIEASHNAHQTWASFNDEIKSLGTVLYSISQRLEKAESQRRHRSPKETSEVDHHWGDVRTSLEDCQRSLERFRDLLDRVKVDESHTFARPLQQFKLNQSAGSMTDLRNQIVSYKSTLQVSLQMISILSIEKTAGSFGRLSTELDQLYVEIRRVRQDLKKQPIAEENEDYPPPLFGSSLPSYETATKDKEVRRNLENCMKSAEKFWSTQSNALGNSTVQGSIDGRSVFGEPLDPLQSAEISEWVSKTSSNERDLHPTDDSVSSESTGNHTHEPESYDESASSVADDTDFKDDTGLSAAEELYHIENCQDEAVSFLKDGDYSAAEDAQNEAIRYLERRHVRQNSQFENKNEMLEVLASIYHKQGKLEKAAKTLKFLAQAPESPPDRPWKWQHRLAEVYLELDQVDSALKCCAAAKRGREKEHGTTDQLFLDSVALCAKIYELRGETRLVKTWKKLYPKAFITQHHEEKQQESVTLLKENGFDSTSESWDAAEGVQWAASEGRLEAVQYLLKKNEGDNVRAQPLESTALIAAASSGQMDILEMVFEKNIDTETLNAEGYTALLLAVQNGHEAAVRLLLGKGASVLARDRLRRRTALHIAQSRSGNEEITKMLLQKGAEVHAQDAKRKRPLHIAAENGQRKAAEILLMNGADIHARDDTSTTALQSAICTNAKAESGNAAKAQERLHLVEILFDHGATGDLGLIGIAKAKSTHEISSLVKKKVEQQEKEKKKKQKGVKGHEKESQKQSPSPKPDKGEFGFSFLPSRRKTTAF